ncbi:MAG: DUF1178 family protein [Bauldia sp.]|mgnify:CR=1 FL=1
MIRYALVCDTEHSFEAWFRSSDDYEKQARGKRVACPTCGSTAVGRQVMAPALVGQRREAAGETPPAAPAVVATLPDPGNPAVLEALRQLRQLALANSEPVGDRFPEEARKIHYREVEPRGIHGKATAEEAKALLEEGVQIQQLPVLPEDRN